MQKNICPSSSLLAAFKNAAIRSFDMTPSLYKTTARDFTIAPYVTSLRYSAGMLKCPFLSEEGGRKIKLHKLRRNGKISKEWIYIT